MAAFIKGDSRINRRGRPQKGKSLTELLEKELAKKRESGNTGKVEMTRALIDLAIVGRDITALKYVYDRVDGRPKENIDTVISGEMNPSIGLPPAPEEADFNE
jgi:hypothetical protein